MVASLSALLNTRMISEQMFKDFDYFQGSAGSRDYLITHRINCVVGWKFLLLLLLLQTKNKESSEVVGVRGKILRNFSVFSEKKE